jgi:protein TonB
MVMERDNPSGRGVVLGRRLLWPAAAVVASVAVNGGILWGLTELQAFEVPEREPAARFSVAPPPEPPPPEPETDPEPEPEPADEPAEPQPEAPTVETPSPTPSPPEPAPVPLDLSAATISPVQARANVAAPPRDEPAQQQPAEEPSGPVATSQLDGKLKRVKTPHYYPEEAREDLAEGSATVRLLIGKDGRVKQASVVDVTGHRSFKGAVKDFIYRWRFSPPRRNGQPVQVRHQETVDFELQY